MAAPWEKYAAPPQQAPTPPGVLGTIPGRVDPYKARDQQLQEEANARAAAAADRAAAAADRAAAKPTVIGGKYILGDDGTAKPIAGIEGVESGSKPLPKTDADDLETKANAFADLKRAVDSFKDDFSGFGAGMENTLQGVTGMGTAGQRDWWADFKKTDIITRNAFFGASLSEGEKSAFAETTITPDMKPTEVKRNLTRRLELAEGILGRRKQFLIANGYKPEAVDALMGGIGSTAEQPPEDVKTEMDRRLVRGDDPADIIQWLVSINRPPNKDEIARIIANSGNPDASSQFAKRKPDPVDPNAGGLGDLVMHGAQLGLSDEASGVGRAAANILMSPLTGRFDPVGAYQAGNAAQDQLLNQARQRSGWAGTAAEVAGGFASGGVGNALAPAATLLGRVGQGARAGAAAGSIGGFGYGEGAGSVPSAALGAVGGAALGAALPVAGQVIGNQVQGVRRMIGRDPALPRNMVSRAIEADGNTPAVVGQVMDDAHARGSPMMLADTGDNTRALLASVGRQPGPSRTLTREAVISRQDAQGDRLSAAVVRDLGPTANIRDMGDELVARAREAARPLYEAFEAAPGASVVKVDDLAARPSFRKALANAVRTAEEEGVDPTALGFRFNEAGEMTLDRDAISWRTMDAVKRGLDDVVEGYRDPTSGRLNLTTNEARATNATLRTLIARMDRVNPTYAEARAAYAGPARMKEAMEKGVKALNKSPDDIEAMMRGMGDSEQESFRLGIRKAIVDKIGTRRDGGDKVAALMGTPKLRTVLGRVFGGRREFERFVQTLRDEEAMGQTYRSVTGNSATAERLAEDATTQDGGLVEAATNSAIRGARNGSGVLNAWVADVFEGLQNASRFGSGEAGQRARESVAALLTETDPAVLRELIQAARQAARDQGRVNSRRGRRAISQGRNLGNLTGMTTGQTTREPR